MPDASVSSLDREVKVPFVGRDRHVPRNEPDTSPDGFVGAADRGRVVREDHERVRRIEVPGVFTHPSCPHPIASGDQLHLFLVDRIRGLGFGHDGEPSTEQVSLDGLVLLVSVLDEETLVWHTSVVAEDVHDGAVELAFAVATGPVVHAERLGGDAGRTDRFKLQIVPDLVVGLPSLQAHVPERAACVGIEVDVGLQRE